MRGLKQWVDLSKNTNRESHLLQMRGLKLMNHLELIWVLRRIFYRCVDWNRFWTPGDVVEWVASFTDAWIETPTKHGQSPAKPSRIFYRCVDWNLCSNGALLASTSHLLQMRGLKHCPQKEYNNPIMSHLLQMRGLKRNQPYKHYRPRQVASFTDAWIETYQSAGVFSQCQSHLLQMRGLKPLFKGAFERVFNVASFTGTTIYNIFCKKITGLKYLFVRK